MDKEPFDKTENFREQSEYRVQVWRHFQGEPKPEWDSDRDSYREQDWEEAYQRFDYLAKKGESVRLQKSIGGGWDTLKEYWPD